MTSPEPSHVTDQAIAPAKRAGWNRVVVIAACVLLPLTILAALAYHTLPTGHEARFVGRWAGTMVVMTPTGAPPGTPTHPEDWEWWFDLRGDGSYVVYNLRSTMRPVAPSGWTPFSTGWWEVKDDVLQLYSYNPWHPLVHRLLRSPGNDVIVIHPIPVRWQGEQLRAYAGASDEIGLNRYDGTWEEFASLAAPP